ncbi:hypothetical protein [Streptomyces hygroscopicus]|uniref:hypothetical protein n=1 Tax=Streptomyces hygroscopicus TaxID=1912 RepID=UPI000B175AF2|nr:hypothetical protein [Streptomyces hygroscopicus]
MPGHRDRAIGSPVPATRQGGRERLHERNHRVVGAEPDPVRPGRRLTVGVR